MHRVALKNQTSERHSTITHPLIRPNTRRAPTTRTEARKNRARETLSLRVRVSGRCVLMRNGEISGVGAGSGSRKQPPLKRCAKPPYKFRMHSVACQCHKFRLLPVREAAQNCKAAALCTARSSRFVLCAVPSKFVRAEFLTFQNTEQNRHFPSNRIHRISDLILYHG